MTAHELAKLLLAGPDLPVVLPELAPILGSPVHRIVVRPVELAASEGEEELQFDRYAPRDEPRIPHLIITEADD